jgi:hypothetical protein
LGEVKRTPIPTPALPLKGRELLLLPLKRRGLLRLPLKERGSAEGVRGD